ncbi:(deoxy)nucleoside triphosphate pyrophosphohydrolase [Paracoccaceae bacterium]|nr:(deoxy)nucleoside triphosphate pyrophosphohydrolase [Paracoccaceae bacterium]
MNKKSVDVVAAVIKKDNLFLIANRSFKANSSGLWEFPGGKVEEKETFVSALIREIEEELSLKIQVGDKITSIDLKASDKHLFVHYFYALILSGQITLNVHSEFKWVERDQLSSFKYIDSDRYVLKHL